MPQPTAVLGNVIDGPKALGTLDSASARIKFNPSNTTLLLNVRVSIPVLGPNTVPKTYNLANLGERPITVPKFFFEGTSNPVCTGCSVTYNGFLSGSTGERLGVAYEINDAATRVNGAVAFQESSRAVVPPSSLATTKLP
jgi:hypothetical protein